jgi:CheY-like chemotaxis protein
MVVDDNPDAAESAGALLAMEGHDVRLAADGIEALEVAREFRPDVMVIDIGLPRLDGYELAGRLRELPETRDALLVALTGYGQPDAVQRSLDAGFDRHFVKPIDPNLLLRVVASVTRTRVAKPAP